MTIAHEIARAYVRQMSYGFETPTTDLKRFVSYVNEECVEILRELTEGPDRYKKFKADKPIDKEALKDELADLYIHVMNTLAVSQISPSELEAAIETKLDYNKSRPDHLIF